MPLPTTVEGITAEWLTAALRFRFQEVTVTDAEVVDVIKGTSTKIRVRLRYNAASTEADLPPTMIVKGGFEAHSPSMADMYLNEIRWYRDVLSRIDMHAPTCWYAGSDPNSHQSVVLIEDLKARGVEFCHPLRPQRYEQVARRLDAMARYHAQTWNSPWFDAGGPFDWVGSRFDGWSVEYQQRYLVPDVWDHYVASPRGAAVSRLFHDRAWMERTLRRLGELHQNDSYCLIHGDTHLGNLYIERDGTPGFFDAQVSRAPWHLEVAYHITGALDIVDRSRWERALVAYYLERLQAYGVDAPAFDDAMTAYAQSLAYGYFIFLINEIRFQTEAINTAYAARFAHAMIDNKTRDLLP